MNVFLLGMTGGTGIEIRIKLLEQKHQVVALARPSRLTNGPGKGNYCVHLNLCPKGGGKKSRKDLADFITKQINSDNDIHQKVTVIY